MCCLSGSPDPKDPRSQYNQREWQTDMCHACCNNCPCCIIALVCCPCSACYIRGMALQGDFNNYTCCQRQCCGDKVGACCSTCEKNCPRCSLACESVICLGFSVTGTKNYIQAERQIVTDPCDNRLVAFSNCLQIFACICQILAIFLPGLESAADCLSCIADIVFLVVQACAQAQVHLELKRFPTPQDYVNKQPTK
eukprot:m.333918 g.333918  ORF g.333918 m.333918 type:complete len:196 (+) comp17245_c0_seq1:95-682(+)